MDNASENANEQVAVAPVVRFEEKSGNNGKREAAEPLENTISAKKQKVEAEVKKVEVPPPKDEESTSTEEDTYSESEEEEKSDAKEDSDLEEKPHLSEEEEESEEEELTETPSKPKASIGNQSERNQSEREVTTIFVGNLPSKVDEDDIAALFKEAGEVLQVRLPKYGHVEFATEEAAKKALEMNQQEFMGCELRVQLAKQKRSRKDNSSIHKGEDEDTAVMMKDTPSPAKSYGKAKSDEKERKTPVGNQNEHGMATIFVGNLPYKANEDEIAAFFKEVGEVIEVRLARYKDGNSKGYGHVEFATEEAAKRALEMKQEFMGRELRLDLGKPKVSSTTPSRKDNSSNHKGEDENTDVVMKDASPAKSNKKKPKTSVGSQNEHGMSTIFVGNLPYKADEDEIAAFFKEAGQVIQVRLARYKDRDSKGGYGHVEFATEEAAKRALEMNWQEFMGRQLRLDMGTPKVSSTPYSSSRGDRRGHGGGRRHSGDRRHGGGWGCGGRGRTRN